MNAIRKLEEEININHFSFAIDTINSGNGVGVFVNAMKDEIARLVEIEKEERKPANDNRPIDFENFKIDLSETIDSGKMKLLMAICNSIGSKSGGFLQSLNDAEITPNNVVAFRTFVLNPLGILLFLSGFETIGASMISLACILDGTDGKLARDFDMKSVKGQIVDAMGDKLQETSCSVGIISKFLLTGNYLLGLIYFLLTGPKSYLHDDSQFKPGRPERKIQLKMLYTAMLREQNTEFIKEKTESAANDFGKWKTGFQFASILGIIWPQAFYNYIDIGTIINASNYIFTSFALVSLPLAIKSIHPNDGLIEGTKKTMIRFKERFFGLKENKNIIN